MFERFRALQDILSREENAIGPELSKVQDWKVAKCKLERSFGPINLTPDTVKWTLPVVNGMKYCTGAVVGRSRTNWEYRAVPQR
ncbi:hypothetical protein PVK06_036392 [Gossypium arboreum]|uniref:Uncharacterized protein n=1 Tax=Gossypium arboreum TaxID=29729 RepID=A0ABR0NJF5_GOSAR|nr:hypothetical protein PVK06_036392 [Gossypium arboreum]